jgi:HSP20 family protein
MHTIIHSRKPISRARAAEPTLTGTFRQPNYDCRDHPDALELVVYVPGVDAAGVEIEARGSDVFVTARKHRFVRVNWQALHLEGAQRDYQLRLRLGERFDYNAMQAEIHEGVLTVTLPKRATVEASVAARTRRVA